MNWYKKAQKFYFIDPDEMKKLLVLVQKIISGTQEWTKEELQLHQNYPNIIEDLLKERVENELV